MLIKITHVQENNKVELGKTKRHRQCRKGEGGRNIGHQPRGQRITSCRHDYPGKTERVSASDAGKVTERETFAMCTHYCLG